MGTFLQDIKFALRALAKQPLFTTIAIVTMALGIGANSAIFSVANAVLLRPLPFKKPERLAMIWEANPKFSADNTPVVLSDFLDLKQQCKSFEGMAVTQNKRYTLTDFGEPEQISGIAMTPDLLPMLGVTPILGREFAPEDAKPGPEQIAIISNGLWKRKFGSDSGIIGKQFLFSDRPLTIVGVLPAGFQLPTITADVWVPLAFTAEDINNRGAHAYKVFARLRQEATFAQADAELKGVMQVLAQQYPTQNGGWTAQLNRLQDEGVTHVRPALLMLLGAVGLLLLIACANIACLMLARASARHRELAIRVALGASRISLARLFFTESLLVSLLGGAAGLLVATWSVSLLIAKGPKDIPRLQETNLDWRVLGFALLLAILTAVLSSLAPILKSFRIDLNESLKEGSKGSSRGFWQLRAIMITEISLAMVLLIGSGLFIRSYHRLVNVNPGLRTENVLITSVSLPFSKYEAGRRDNQFFQELLTRVQTLPGVASAALANNVPLAQSTLFFFINVEGHSPERPGDYLQAQSHTISPDYFRTLAIPLIKGRVFDERDNTGGQPTIIINESLAKQFFPNTDPIGKTISILANNHPPRTVIGVVGDVKHKGLDKEFIPEMFVSYQQDRLFSAAVLLHTKSDPMGFAAAVKEQIWSMDKNLPILRVTTMDQLLDATVAQQRFNTTLLGAFALLALLLASVGVYGLMAYSVNQSTREIGIRVALGAQRAQVFKLVVGQGLVLMLIGLVIGLPLAIGFSRLTSTLLFGITANDPITYVAISLLLTSVVVAACLIPARRAAKVDPMIALRYE